MSSFKTFDIAGSGMAAQSVRLNTTASNLANADSVSGDAGRRLQGAPSDLRGGQGARSRRRARASKPAPRSRCSGIYESTAPANARYEPGNPLADAKGYVYAPAVNVVEEMVNMISASRSYQNNVEVMNTSKELLLATLRLGQG